MPYLFVVSLIWAFSFGLIKGNLAGIDSNFVSFTRMLLSFLVFIPFLRLRNTDRNTALRLVLCGAVQYGIMYITYIYAFGFLKAYEVALFTVLTPLYVTLTGDMMERRFNLVPFISAILAIAGAGIVVYSDVSRSGLIAGFLLVQLSNLAFAFGQIYYIRIMKQSSGSSDIGVFALMYGGALVLTGLFSAATVEFSALHLGVEQILTIIYLGVVASGLCFFLWNLGARKTSTGTLAVFNNLKIPLAIAVSLIVFGEEVDIIRLFAGGAIVVLALLINERRRLNRPGTQRKLRLKNPKA